MELTTVTLLGSVYSAVKKEDFKKIMIEDAKAKKPGYVCISNVHTTVMGVLDPHFQKVTNSARHATLDGMPLVWLARLLGARSAERVRGPSLMKELCDEGRKIGLKHYFYGGSPQVLEKLVEQLKKDFPGIEIAGYVSPPFRPLTEEEQKADIQKINDSGAHIVWVGLGAPKQENWMNKNSPQIHATLVGVGAAFDFLSGQVSEAPQWMQKMGLEWFYRLTQEPKRLWKRYFIYNSLFLLYSFKELVLRYSKTVVFSSSLFLFYLQSIAWPLAPGRDSYSYFYYFLDLGNPNPADPFTMKFRTPLAPVFNVFLIRDLGPLLAEAVMGIAYALSVTFLFSSIQRAWYRKFAWLFFVILSLHFSYASMFHVVSNDPVVAITTSLLFAFVLRVSTYRFPKKDSFAILGLWSSLAMLARPGLWLLMVGLPLFFKRFDFRKRSLLTLIAFLGFLPIYLGWCAWNKKVFDSFSFTLGADVAMPLARTLSFEKTVAYANGPATQKVAHELLQLSDETEINKAFSEKFGYADLMLKADQVWGVGQYTPLKQMAFEAIRAHPMPFVLGVSKTFLWTLSGNYKLPVPLTNGAFVYTHKNHVAFQKDAHDQFVSLSELDPHSLQRDAATEAIFKGRGEKVYQAYLLESKLPMRDGNISLGSMMNRVSQVFPPMLLWIALGILWFGLQFFRGSLTLQEILVFVFAMFGVATILLASMTLGVAVYQYRIPFDPFFILAGLLPIFHFFTKKPNIRFRPADFRDSEQLLDWRNDPGTLKGSVQNKPIEFSEHQKWYTGTLQNYQRDIFVAEVFQGLVWKRLGTVRYDSRSEYQATELSWTVAPEFRGQGFGYVMVLRASQRHGGKLICRIKDQNSSSLKIAQKIGYTFFKREGEMQFFELQKMIKRSNHG